MKANEIKAFIADMKHKLRECEKVRGLAAELSRISEGKLTPYKISMTLSGHRRLSLEDAFVIKEWLGVAKTNIIGGKE